MNHDNLRNSNKERVSRLRHAVRKRKTIKRKPVNLNDKQSMKTENSKTGRNASGKKWSEGSKGNRLGINGEGEGEAQKLNVHHESEILKCAAAGDNNNCIS